MTQNNGEPVTRYEFNLYREAQDRRLDAQDKRIERVETDVDRLNTDHDADMAELRKERTARSQFTVTQLIAIIMAVAAIAGVIVAALSLSRGVH